MCPAISNPSIGIGLNGVTDWTTQSPFIDVFKTARDWVGHLEGQWGGASAALMKTVMDAQGWLTALPEGVSHVSTMLLTSLPAEMTSAAGRYRMTYEGEGTIAIYGATNVVQNDGEIWFTYTPNGRTGITIDITEINETDYLRNVSVVHERDIGRLEDGEIFNPRWLDLIQDMRSLRFMDWQHTNGSTLARWADRATQDDATWGTAAGVPLEVMVELANQTGTDPWFNIPFNANRDFISRFVRYVEENLDPELKPYFEMSNEVWNWQFGQTHTANTVGQSKWPGVGTAYLQEYAARAVEMAKVIDQVYGPNVNDRVYKVISSQTGWEGLEEAVFDAPDYVASTGNNAPYTYFNSFAITGYFDGALGRDEKAATVKTWLAQSLTRAERAADAANLTGAARAAYIAEHRYDHAGTLAFRELRDGSVTGDATGSLQSLYATFAYYKRVTDARGLELVMYEGGTHVVGVNDWQSDDELTDFFLWLNQHDEMGTLYTELFQGWRDAGGTMFNAFVDVASHSKFGSWGALQHIDDQSARWDALTRFNELVPAWWETRAPGAFIGSREDGGPPPDNTLFGTPGHDTIQGTAGADRIDGLGGNDSLRGMQGDDTIYGGSGNDTLIGDAGFDQLHGGTGNDLYIVDSTGDLVIELAGQGIDTVRTPVNWTLSDHVENLVQIGTANLQGTGNALDNTITGNAGHNTLSGGAGNDTINGGNGDDLINGDDGNDMLSGQNGRDTINGGAGDDTLQGLNDDDVLDGGAGNDSLSGGNGNDRLQGGIGNDSLNAGGGNDTVNGGNGHDYIWGVAGNNLLQGGTGNDTIDSGNDSSTIQGGAGDDRLIIRWDHGARHVVSGEAGADTFDFLSRDSALTSVTTIRDFEVGIDTLKVEGVIVSRSTPDSRLEAAGISISTAADGSLVVHFDGGDTIRLLGVTADLFWG